MATVYQDQATGEPEWLTVKPGLFGMKETFVPLALARVRDDREVELAAPPDRPTTDEAMTRSEERMHVGTATEETGRARLRKYVVTETVQQSVPVSHEEVRLEREPVTEANSGRAMAGPEISEEEHEVTLHA